MPEKVVVVGAGPVGALAALYAARRGYDVELYEFRGDLRDPTTVPLSFTKSINLAISERGLNSIKQSGSAKLLDGVLAETIPMHGRMIHGKKAGKLYEESQAYDAFGRYIRAIDRAGLNKRLLDELDGLPNVKLFFNHKLIGADFKQRRAWFEQRDEPRKDHAQNPTGKDDGRRQQEVEVTFDVMLGADGAHSATRYHMMKYARTSYSQEYIDTLWCEFHMEPNGTEYRLSPNHLHIWPAGDSMFIAIPSLGGSFTCTLFAPADTFAALEVAAPPRVVDFFNSTFPGVAGPLIPEEDICRQFTNNPHLPLISIKTTPYHYSSSVVILGDAAHAMVPFYGQGMNAGLEDVRVLFETLDAHPQTAPGRSTALDEYTQLRTPDAHAINDLALRNYREMRADVVSPLYRLRKTVEEALSKYVPALGFATQYSRVSFSNMRYSDVEKLAARQGLVLSVAGAVTALTPVLWYVVWAFTRWRNATRPGRGLAKGMFSLGILGEKFEALFAG